MLAAALLAGATLDRETELVAALAVAVPRLWRQCRPALVDLVWGAPAVAFAGWQAVCRAAAGQLLDAVTVRDGQVWRLAETDDAVHAGHR